MLTLYGNLESGNVYKVRLILALTGTPHRRVEVNQVRGEPRSAAFRAINPIAKVPAVHFDDGRNLAESGAILYWFARGTKYFPDEPWAQAQILQWMFFEQYSHEPYIAVARFWIGFAPAELLEPKRHLIPEWHTKGNAALGVMQTRLARHDWFAGGRYSIADIALYGYTHCAADCGFDLSSYPAVGAWLKRVAAQPGHVPLELTW